MTTEPPYDPNENQVNVTEMSFNEDSITLGGEQKSINNTTHPRTQTTVHQYNLNDNTMAVMDAYSTVYNEKIYNEPNSILQNSTKAIMNIKPQFEKIHKQSAATAGMSTQGTLQKYDKELRPGTQYRNNEEGCCTLKSLRWRITGYNRDL